VKLCLALIPLLAGCAAQVYHPTRTLAEQKRDIAICTEHAELSEPLEPLAALHVAYECLEQKGYKRGKTRPTIG
jgi:hypothetical protein